MSDNRPTVANLDFASVKQDMISYFKNKPEFADYEFTGSSLNLLMDILAYNTHYNAMAANFLVNEMFLDSATIRNNIVSHAKLLNYTPRSSRTAKANITIRVTKTAGEKLVIIPGGSLFTATVGNLSTSFYTIKDYIIQFSSLDADGTTKTIDIDIYEGKLATERNVVTKSSESNVSFEINNYDVDTSTLVVAVNGVRYEEVEANSDDLFSVNENSTIYFVEESRTGNYKVVFGNGNIGKAPQVGDEILISYLITSGTSGNGISTFAPSIPNRPNLTITAVNSISQGGSDRETINEIKDQAPKWYQSQYRAVTENDYEAIIRSKFGDIQAINVYGGEEVGKPGKVFVAIKPISSAKLSDSSKYTLKQEIIKSSNVVTVEPTIVDADIVEIILKTVVIYDKNKTPFNPDVLKAKVYALQTVFNSNYIGDFGKAFRESNFSREIQDLDTSIVSSMTRPTIKVTSVVDPTSNLLDKLQFDLYNQFYHPEAGFKPIFSSSNFKRVGQTVYSGFDDDGNGNIRLYDIRDNIKVYINNTAGTIDYSNGSFEITSNATIQDSSVDFYIIPDSFDIEGHYNNILEISNNESVVDVVEQQEKEIIKSINLGRSI